MDYNNIRIGMKIIGKNFTGAFQKWNGCTGKVIAVLSEDSRINIAVEFNKKIQDGHSCALRCKDGFGRWFYTERHDNKFSNDEIDENLLFLNVFYMLEQLEI